MLPPDALHQNGVFSVYIQEANPVNQKGARRLGPHLKTRL